MSKKIRVKFFLNDQYKFIYDRLYKKGLITFNISKDFFLCFFCNPFVKRKEVSRFLYEVFKQKFINYEMQLAKEEKTKKQAFYTIENPTFLISSKKELESLLSAQILTSDYDFFNHSRTLNRFFAIEPSRFKFKAKASLIRFILLAFHELIIENKQV